MELETSVVQTGDSDRFMEDVRECTTIDDLNKLYQEVAVISQWDFLCSYLGVDTAIMNDLRYLSDKDKKLQCLQAYYDSGAAYWEEVIIAINKHPIKNRRVAKIILDKYGLNSDLLGMTSALICRWCYSYI